MDDTTFEERYEEARRAGELANRTEPRIIEARYDETRDRIKLVLRDGSLFEFSPAITRGLMRGTPRTLGEVSITPAGDGLHFPTLDEDLGIIGLLRDRCSPLFEMSPVDRLCIEIEGAWAEQRNPRRVDELAAAYPVYAEELYDFFAVLIEAELDIAYSVEELERSAARTSDWLEREGYALAVSIADEIARGHAQ